MINIFFSKAFSEFKIYILLYNCSLNFSIFIHVLFASTKYTLEFKCFVFTSFIQQGHIQLIKNDSKDIYNCTKDFYIE